MTVGVSKWDFVQWWWGNFSTKNASDWGGKNY